MQAYCRPKPTAVSIIYSSRLWDSGNYQVQSVTLPKNQFIDFLRGFPQLSRVFDEVSESFSQKVGADVFIIKANKGKRNKDFCAFCT